MMHKYFQEAVFQKNDTAKWMLSIFGKQLYTLPETNIALEDEPFEDVFPIENGDFLLLY